jgi:putative membrane protein
MTKTPARPPAAFRLSDKAVLVEDPSAPHDAPRGKTKSRTVVTAEADAFAKETGGALVEVPAPVRRGFGWGKLFVGALSSLVTFAVGIWVTDFVMGLFTRDDVLGWIALGLAALTALALVAIVGREIAGLMRLARVTHIRAGAEKAANTDDRDVARRIVGNTIALYSGRPETARARAEIGGHIGEIIDGRDLLRLAEKALMTRMDAEAKALITGAAKRVSVVTAVSPRALIDVAYVLVETVRLVRRIGILYGGRPSGLALFRLLKLSLAHLAVTGGIAMTDSLVQQLVGHGIAARLSARLGEGVVNGMMTARVGLAALDVCRPLPWLANSPPGISDVMSTLVARSSDTNKAADKGD